MGWLSTCVAVFAVLIGLTVTGTLTRLGVFLALGRGIENLGFYEISGVLPAFEVEESKWRFHYEDIKDGSLAGQVALVTGGNAGLGKYTALHLAEKGATVVLACRSPKKCEKAAQEMPGKTVTMTVDLSSLKSVEDFSKKFLAKFDRLDIFVQNGGISFSPHGETTKDGVELLFHTNHLGHFLMTKRFEKLLLKTAESHPVRIVAVSSAAHYHLPRNIVLFSSLEDHNSNFQTHGNYAYYAISKLCNVLFMQSLSKRFAGKNIYANSLGPGMTATNITQKPKAYLRDVVSKYPKVKPILSPVGEFAIYILETIESNVLWTSDEGALTQYYLAASPEVYEKKISGKFFAPQAREVPPNVRYAQGEKAKELADRLWKFSEGLLNGK